MQYIIVKGDPVNGFNFEGPYPDRDAAVEKGDSVDTEWWVASLEPPEEPDWREGFRVGQTPPPLLAPRFCRGQMSNWACSRPLGHHMPHVASSGKVIVAVWDDEHFEDKRTKGVRP